MLNYEMMEALAKDHIRELEREARTHRRPC